MFYGLATNKLDTGELHFQHLLKDIQTLNEEAMRGTYDVTAISFHAYAYIARQVCFAAARRFDWRQLRPDRRLARAGHARRHSESEDRGSGKVDQRVSGAAHIQFRFQI